MNSYPTNHVRIHSSSGILIPTRAATTSTHEAAQRIALSMLRPCKYEVAVIWEKDVPVSSFTIED